MICVAVASGAAGGWSKRGQGVPLLQRISPGLVCPAQHCWVAGAVDGHDVPRPGLLLEWRRTPGGWQGRVAYVAHVRADSWAMVEEWLPAGQLGPAPVEGRDHGGGGDGGGEGRK